MTFLERAIEYTVYLGIVIALLFAVGALLGNVEVLMREVIDNLLTGVAHVVLR